MKQLFTFLFFTTPVLLFAQIEVSEEKQGKYHLFARKTTETVKLDGVLDENMWINTDVARDFWQKFPFDSSFASIQTEAKISYSNHFIYVALICYHPVKQGYNNYVTNTLKRDFEPDYNDMAAVYFDPFLDQINGFAFGTTPYGVQREGLIANGGGDGVFAEWDNKWYLETKRYEDKWIAEMAIPFKSLRFKAGTQKWRLQFYRQDLKNNESSTWTKSPRNFGPAVMSFYGELEFEEPLQAAGSNVSLIPYLAGNTITDQENEKGTEYKGRAGLDAKIAVTSSLNLDLTVNPDFSNVEADVQQTNLSRFELFFPERRQFFLENSDMFAEIGFPGVRPFFSRRIGISYDTTLGLYRQNPVLLGARLSGKIDKNWRVGLLSMQTDKTNTQGSTNYSVAVLQRKIFTRSNVSAFMVNKQIFGDSNGFSWKSPHFNRAFGAEYGLFSKNNKWTGDFFYHSTFTDDEKNKDRSAAGGFISYQTPEFTFDFGNFYVGENYNAEVGYVPRKGYMQNFVNPVKIFYPKGEKVRKILNNHGFGFKNTLIVNTNSTLKDSVGNSLGNKLLDRETIVFYFFNFLSSSQFNVYGGNIYTYLFNPFDPTNSGGKELPANVGYQYQFAGLEFQSNTRKRFMVSMGSDYGTYFNGKAFYARFNVSYRWQPYGIFSLSGTIQNNKLPSPYNSGTLLLLGPRVDLSFNRKLFFTTFLQYNNQIKNINLNSRLQWRFKPVSDVFLVYADNYLPENLAVKNRSVVLKITYWLNM
jgi:hypothetical protein